MVRGAVWSDVLNVLTASIIVLVVEEHAPLKRRYISIRLHSTSHKSHVHTANDTRDIGKFNYSIVSTTFHIT